MPGSQNPFASLPLELLHLIFANLTAHADFHALCLVSRTFYGAAIRFLYRRIILPHKPCNSQAEFTAPLNALLSPTQQRKLVSARNGAGRYRELSGCGEFVKYFKLSQRGIRGGFSGGGEVVEAAIENMSRLECFVWQTVTTSPPAIARTPQISAALAAKPNLRHLSLDTVFADTDSALLRLPPLRSLALVLESNFASFAHRSPPTRSSPSPEAASPAADYDIIHGILHTSAATLQYLSLRSSSTQSPQYADTALLFGTETTTLSLPALTSLMLTNRALTLPAVEALTHTIDFTHLHTLTIHNCTHTSNLLTALSLLPLTLHTLNIQASQPLLTTFLTTLPPLTSLSITPEPDHLDWTSPGGIRRRFSTGEATSSLIDTILRHGNTLQRLSLLPGLQKLFLRPAALERLLTGCKALRELSVCVGFLEWAKVAAALAEGKELRRVWLYLRDKPCEREEVRVGLDLQDLGGGRLRVVGVGGDVVMRVWRWTQEDGGKGKWVLRGEGKGRRGGLRGGWRDGEEGEPFREDY